MIYGLRFGAWDEHFKVEVIGSEVRI